MTQAESKLSGRIIDDLLKQGIFAFKVHGSAYMVAGLPDIIACVDGHFVGLETKMPAKRNNVSEIQKLRHAQIKHAGGIAEVVCGPKEAGAIIERVRAELAKPSAEEVLKELLCQLLDWRAGLDEADGDPRAGAIDVTLRRQGERRGLNRVIEQLRTQLNIPQAT